MVGVYLLLITFNVMIYIGDSSGLFSSYFTTTFVGAEELMPNEKLLITNLKFIIQCNSVGVGAGTGV